MYTQLLITELHVKRRIWVYLPNGYDISNKHYPVLYMQDGQNLFEAKTSYSGEWEIDEYLDSIDFSGIVIGIDNGGEKRMNEYNPNNTASHGKGLGKEYLQRVVDILKPYVDAHFRTFSDAKNTAIAGSSMGGLISFYAGLYHPSVFGAVGVFSPSFWLVPNLEEQVSSLAGKPHQQQRYYFYGGGRESANLLSSMESVGEVLKEKSACDITFRIAEKGTHSESSWRKMFPGFYEWLMKPLG